MKFKPTHKIIWLTGQTGAGKTMLANVLAPMLGAIVLDRDEMRESISLGAGFSKEYREADKLYVLEDGRITESGAPGELLKKKGTYFERMYDIRE